MQAEHVAQRHSTIKTQLTHGSTQAQHTHSTQKQHTEQISTDTQGTDTRY